MSEEWRPVVGWEGLYEVSSLGHVRTIPRVVRHGTNHKTVTHVKQLVLAISKPNSSGHVLVRFCTGGRQCHRQVHRVVLEAFVGPCPAGMICRHLERRMTRARRALWGHGYDCERLDPQVLDRAVWLAERRSDDALRSLVAMLRDKAERLRDDDAA